MATTEGFFDQAQAAITQSQQNAENLLATAEKALQNILNEGQGFFNFPYTADIKTPSTPKIPKLNLDKIDTKDLENTAKDISNIKSPDIKITTNKLPKLDYVKKPVLTKTAIQNFHIIPTRLLPIGDLPDITIPSIDSIKIPDFNITLPNYPTIPEMPNFDDIPEPQLKEYPLPEVPDLKPIPDVELNMPNYIDIPDEPEIDMSIVDEIPDSSVNYHENINIVFNEIEELKKEIDEFSLLRVDNEIFSSDIERKRWILNQSIDRLKEEYNQLGFTIPIGSMIYNIHKLIEEHNNELRDNSFKIAAETAQLAHQDKKEMLVNKIRLLDTFINYLNSYWNRVLEVIKMEKTLAVDIYRLKLSTIDFLIKKVQMDIDLFNLKLKQELSKLDINRALIENARLKSQLNTDILNMYVTQVKAVETQYAIQAQKIDIFKQKLSAQMIKLEAYKSKISAFAAVTDVETRKMEAQLSKYEAELNAIKTKAQVDVDVFKSKIDAEALKVDTKYKMSMQKLELNKENITQTAELNKANIAAISALNQANLQKDIEYNRALLEEYRQELNTAKEKFLAEMQVFTEKLKADITKADIDLKKYSTEIQAKSMEADAKKVAITAQLQTQEAYNNAQLKYYTALIEDFKAKIQKYTVDLNTNLEKLKFSFDSYIKQRDLALKSAESYGQISSGLAMAAMSSASTMLDAGARILTFGD